MRVGKWGDSLAARLPSSVVKALRLKAGDHIEIHVSGARTFELTSLGSAREFLARLRKNRGKLSDDFKFDRLKMRERQ